MYNASNILRKAQNRFPIRGKHRDRQYYRKIYLQSDHWKELKLQKMEQISYCEECKSPQFLDVHHVNYKKLYDVIYMT